MAVQNKRVDHTSFRSNGLHNPNAERSNGMTFQDLIEVVVGFSKSLKSITTTVDQLKAKSVKTNTDDSSRTIKELQQSIKGIEKQINGVGKLAKRIETIWERITAVENAIKTLSTAVKNKPVDTIAQDCVKNKPVISPIPGIPLRSDGTLVPAIREPNKWMKKDVFIQYHYIDWVPESLTLEAALHCFNYMQKRGQIEYDDEELLFRYTEAYFEKRLGYNRLLAQAVK